MNLLRILAVIVLVAPGARAESFSPESAAVFALRQNRDLVAARYLIAEAEGRLVQAGLWRNPEFELGTEFDARDRQGDRRFGAGFMQKFPLAGRLAKARAVARVDVAMAIEELRDKERMLAGQVLGKARALLVLDRKLSINDENRALLARILQQTTSLAAVGKADSGDARVIELEQMTLALSRDGIVVERRAMLAEVNGLLGRTPAAELTITGDLPTVPPAGTLAAAARAATQRRPDRRLAALQVDKSRAEKLLARAENWEDVSLGFDVSREREERMVDTMIGLKVSVPLPFWNRNQGRVAETQAAQNRAAGELAARDLAIATEVREAEIRLAGFARVVEKTRGAAIDLARKNTELLEQTYATGTTPFLTIFESRRQRLMVQQTAVETEERFATALSDWETRTGYFPLSIRSRLHAVGRDGKDVSQRRHP